jgi:hypothetical protein
MPHVRCLLQATTCLQMQGAYQLQRLALFIEWQTQKSYLLATAIVEVQNISDQIQLSQHNVTHNIQLCYKKTVWNSIRSNPPWQQSNKHVKSISHTQFNNNWKINSHASNQDETQSQWDISPHCRAKITCNSTLAGTRSRIQDPTSQFHKEYEELGHREPVTSQEGRVHVTTYHAIPSSRKQVPQQGLELCSMEEPKLPMDCH